MSPRKRTSSLADVDPLALTAHTKTAEQLSRQLGVDLDTGLTDDQIEAAQKKYGPNGESPSIDAVSAVVYIVDFWIEVP